MPKLIRKAERTQQGRFSVPGDETEVTIDASIQPVGAQTRQFYPEGYFDQDDRVIYIRGQVTIEMDDEIEDDKGIRFVVTEITDWREVGNYVKCIARKVR